MKHKFLTVLLAVIAALCLCLGLAACGGNGDNAGNGGDSGNAEDTETHTWSAWEVTEEATCTEEGSRTRTCSECGKVETETIPAKDHTYNESNVCTVCGHELSPTLGLEYELYEETEYPRGEYYRVKGMGTATDQSLVIPAYHAGKKVRRIGANAFNGKDALTSIYIPNGVEVIGMNAFSYCISLTSLRLPNSVKTIGKQAFYGCSKVQDITLGTSGITIVDGAFGNTAYYQNDKNWENGALYIGAHLIATNNNLPSVYTVKEGTRSIATKAFANRSELVEIVMPSSYTLGTNLFDYCYKLTKATAHLNSLEELPGDKITDLTVSGGTIYKSEADNQRLRRFRNLETLFINTDWEDRLGTYGNEKAPLAGLGKLKNLKVKWLSGSCDSYPMHVLFGNQAYDGSVEVKQGTYDAKTNRYTANTHTAHLPAELEAVTILERPISSGTFDNCTMISNITIGSGVTSIGNGAFYGCSGLKSITIPEGVTAIGRCVFSGCSGLTSVIWNAENCTSSGASYRSIFENCTNLKTLTFGENVKSIPEFTGYDCSGLTSVTIPDGVISIGLYAFYNCDGLTSITIPDSVTEIGFCAFAGCSGLEYISVTDGNPKYHSQNDCLIEAGTNTLVLGCKNSVIPDSVTSIGGSAFSGCSGLTGELKIPNGVTSIGDKSFLDCSGLKNVTIGSGVTSIGERAFYGCSGLESITVDEGNQNYSSQDGILYNKAKTEFIYIPQAIKGSVTIPNSVTSIGSDAFYGCSGLKNVTIGSGATSIGERAFYGCDGLESITVDEGNQNYSSQDGILYNKAKTEFIYIPQAIKGSVTIPNSVTSIGEYAFRGCSGLTSITIPDSVTSIGDWAFSYCSGLESVTIGSGVTSIGDCAFADCSELTSVTIPDSVTSIGDFAFYGCSGLTSVTIGSGVTSIGDKSFLDCSGLTGVYITDLAAWCNIDFSYYEANPLYYVHHLYLDGEEVKELIIPKGVTEIKRYAFHYCSGLESVTIGSGVTSIGTQAFSDCSGLTSVTIPDSVTEIGNSAFSGCSGLTSITIPNGVTSIGDCAFYGCSGLTSVTIGSGVTEIGERAFEYCSGLESISVAAENAVYRSEQNCLIEKNTNVLILGCKNSIIPDDVSSIGGRAFFGCSGLASIDIPNGVTSIGDCAFYGCSGLTSVTIGSGVTEIGESAFEDCYKLVEVWNDSKLGLQPGSSDNGGVAGYAKHIYTTDEESKQTVTEDGYIFYEDGDEIYLLDYNGTETELTLPATSPTGKSYDIYQYAFYRNKKLTSVVIPNGVTSIGEWAFSGCSGLESISVAAENAVYRSEQNCLIEKNTNILILGCKNSIIPDGVTSIGGRAFSNCDGLTSITIPDSVTEIGDCAFYNCSGLKSVTIGSGVSSIGRIAFRYCSGLTGVYITNLAAWYKIDFEDFDANPLSHAHHLYLDGEEVKELIIPKGVTEIKARAFYDCSGLTSVTIPDSVTEIGEYAFYGCTRLKDVYFNGTIEKWKEIDIGKYSYADYQTTIHCTNGIVTD